MPEFGLEGTPPTFRFEIDDFFDQALQAGLARFAFQFRCRASAHQYRLVYERTLRYLNAGAKVLDWGCGNGHFSYFLTQHGISTTGFSFDPKPTMLELASLFTYVRGSEQDPVTLPFPESSFDAVFSIGVLEHVRETGGSELGSLQEIHRILRPGGYFMCYHFPNKYGWIEPIKQKLLPSSHFHRYKYTTANIRELVSVAGLSLIEMGTYGFLPRNEMCRLPASLSMGRGFVSWIDKVDNILCHIASRFSQNFLFVAKRTVD